MASFIQMQLINFANIPGILQQHGDEQVQKVGDASERAANDGLDVANELCPVDTGYLISRNEVVPMQIGGTTFYYALRNDAPYALFVILGTYKMAAQDFFTPALAYGRAQLQNYLAEIGP